MDVARGAIGAAIGRKRTLQTYLNPIDMWDMSNVR